MGGSAVQVPYASYLRVYEPLAAFPEPERTHWHRYAAAGRARGAQDELRQSLEGLVPVPPIAVPVHESREAFVAEVGGITHVCPWRTRLRGWMALEQLEGQLPGPVLDAMVPPVVRRQAAADHEAWRERHPDARPWIRSATWHVPVRWFILVGDDEREYEPVGAADPAGGSKRPVMRYRTPMVQARRRVARGLRVLKEALDESPLVDGLIDVGRWLEEFHPRSLVELDYGGLVHVIGPEALAADHSAADAAEGLAALREGDSAAAGTAYERLTDRWRAVRELQFAN
ncbi:hypothetical protein RVR_4330 [Actinacidiphila reveromycinica]|uniref:DUF8083 domain-containing protein n=1 Tax=Actinacidiphila reveromycinica TaxID=659352 RepID=A0A7U3UTA1_9ACTN|nr:hypothetical protein [Streptomyces sp. SN-593]BBA98221.1 hypothetical protein RVR_4330 [Streptomyces sp. SN-593]